MLHVYIFMNKFIWNKGQVAAVSLEWLPVVCESIHFFFVVVVVLGVEGLVIM